MTPFEKVFTSVLNYWPELAFRNNSLIYAWLDSGCDPDKDICPTIDRLSLAKKKRGETVGDLRYFHKEVLNAKKIREESTQTYQEAVTPSDERRARMIATTVRKFGKRDTVNERWLADYEAKYGEVVL